MNNSITEPSRTPKVSVITGFYNRGSVLERTICSVMDQTYTDFEFIVFDDASTDDTAARLIDFSERYGARFRYILHAENRGFVRGLIDAIESSSGEYIAIQGSGDVSLPNRLELQTEYLDQYPSIGVVGGWYYNVVEDIGARRLRQPRAEDATLQSLIRENVFSHGEVMMRRSEYDSVGGYRDAFTFAQDIDLWLRLIQVTQFGTVATPIYERFVQADGVSYSPSKVIRQAQFSLAARAMAQGGSASATAAFQQLEMHGPNSLFPVEGAEMQKRISRAVLRSTLFGHVANARLMTQNNVTGAPRRAMLNLIIMLCSLRTTRPIVDLLRKILGIRRSKR